MSDADIIKTAQDLYKRDREAWAPIYKLGKEDIRFLSDDKLAQWDEQSYNRRKDRNLHTLTIDQLGQFVHKVVNDFKMNTPTINVIPSDDAADEDTAEFYKGKIKDIEYRSGADDAYDMGVESAVKGSIGFIRIDHDFVDDSNNQELFIKRVVNPFSITIDSNSVEADGCDAMHGHVIETMSTKKFQARFPGKVAVSFESDESAKSQKEDEEVAICEFFQIAEETRDVAYLDDGSMVDYQKGQPYKARRTLKKRTVNRYTLSGNDILEQTTFPGEYIPLVPVYGEEAWDNGKRKLHSLIRKSKDAQRKYNLQASTDADLAMKQPEAPFAAAAGSTENYKEDYLDPSKSMVLRYDAYDEEGRPLPPPTRLAPPSASSAFANGKRESLEEIKSSMGLYNASIGQRSNEVSGIAINARKTEGDVATYHFGDNGIKSITHVGRICVCAMPEIYDTPRIVRTIGEEDDPKPVGINGALAEGQEQTIDLKKGKYEVRVITGPSFTTRRQEAAQFYNDIVTKVPELMPVMGDLAFKYSDIEGSQALASRMKKFVDPKYLEEKDRQAAMAENPPPDPEKQQMAQVIQQSQQSLQEMQQQIAGLEKEIQSKDFENKSQKAQDNLKSQYDALKAAEQIATLKIDNQKKDLEIASLRALQKQQPAEIEQSGSMQ